MGSLRQNPLMVPQDGTIVMSEANSGLPLKGDFERMARRRFQNPTPFREGNWWWIRIWQDEFRDGKPERSLKRLKVAPATTNAREAQKIATEMLRPMNQGLGECWFGNSVRSVHPEDLSAYGVSLAGILNPQELRVHSAEAPHSRCSATWRCAT